MGVVMPRDYQREYADQKKLGESGSGSESGNAKRHRARREALKLGMVKPGQDVDHKKPISKGGTNAASNLRSESVHTNRSFPRNKDGSMIANHPKTKS